MGWSRFRKRVVAERGFKCEVCGVAALTVAEKAGMTGDDRSRRALHLHHKHKTATNPDERYKRENIVVCCQSCHLVLENNPAAAEKLAVHSRPSPYLPAVARFKEAGAKRPKFMYGDELLQVDHGRISQVAEFIRRGQAAQRAVDALLTAPAAIEPQAEATAAAESTGKLESPQRRVYTDQSQPKSNVSLGFKLRQQAMRLGYKPGSPQWRAYVLGTQAAQARGRRK